MRRRPCAYDARWLNFALGALFLLFALPVPAAEDAEVAVNVVEANGVFHVTATLDSATVRPQTAWEVMTDFDHMTSILGDLKSSKIVRREGNRLLVRQQGVAKYGILSFDFESEREVRLEPGKRILARNIAGTMKRMESEAVFSPAPNAANGVHIGYRAEMEIDSGFSSLFGAPFLRHEIGEQFRLMLGEMKRREAAQSGLANRQAEAGARP